MGDDLNFDTLDEALRQLPPETPFFLPDEALAFCFPPWASDGQVDLQSLDAAKQFGERFGCIFTYDSFMRSWCFTKKRVSN